MNLFNYNYTFYFLIFFSIVIITSGAVKKKSRSHHHQHHHDSGHSKSEDHQKGPHHHPNHSGHSKSKNHQRIHRHVTSQSGFKAQEMCNKYVEQVCHGKVSSRRLKRSLGNVHNDFSIKHIIGGIPATPKQYPHMALIGSETDQGVFWYCGGSLISKNFILTAAHCTRPPKIPIPTLIRLGELDFKSTTDDATPVDFKILKIIIHPHNKPYDYDIALFKFEGVSTFTEYIRPICLNVFENIPNQKLYAQGWGVTEEGGISTKLRTVELELQDDAKCKFRKSGGKRMLCIGYLPGGKDTCDGDSGGPVLFINNQTECPGLPIYTQVGILSYGPEICGLPNSAAAYTKVSYFISWIESIVWNTT